MGEDMKTSSTHRSRVITGRDRTGLLAFIGVYGLALAAGLVVWTIGAS